MIQAKASTSTTSPATSPFTGDPPGAVVIGGSQMALGVVRSLGRRGIPVWVLADDHLVAGTSRYTRRTVRWPESDPNLKIRCLLDLPQGLVHGWALFPTDDVDVELVARHHLLLSKLFRVTTAPWETIRWASDKRLTYDLADRLGIDYPWTRYPADREEVAGLDCAFPVILKPAVKEGINPLTRAKAWRAESREELLTRYDEASRIIPRDQIMIQALIPGGGEAQFSYAALCQEGLPLAVLVARRTRQYPLDFGRASSFVETVERPEIEDPSRRFLAETRFTGLVELEFKHDRRDGKYKLLDVNPRVWAWHSLGRRAGVDFPYLNWLMVQGEPVPETRARAGAAWLRLSSDLPAAIELIRAGQLSLRSYLGNLLGRPEFAILALDDPLPALLDVPLLYLALRSRRRKAASKAEPDQRNNGSRLL